MTIYLHEVVKIETVEGGAVANRDVPGNGVAFRLVNGEAAAALADVHVGGSIPTAAGRRGVAGCRGRVTTGPRETGRQSQHLVVLRA